MAEDTEMHSVIKKHEYSYLFNKPVGEVRLPIEFFDKSKRLSSFIGNMIETYGIFYLYYWDSLEAKEMEKRPGKILFTINGMILTKPSYSYQKGTEVILEYNMGDVLIDSTLIIQSIENQKRVLSMLFSRFIPDNISYSGIFRLWEDCKNLNKINLKSPASLLELIVAEMCRNPENLNETFRMYLKKNPNASEYSRVLVNLLELPKYSSTFGSISSANPVHGTTKAVARNRRGEPETISPVEEHIK